MSKESEDLAYINYFKRKENELSKLDYLIQKIEKIEKLLISLNVKNK